MTYQLVGFRGLSQSTRLPDITITSFVTPPSPTNQFRTLGSPGPPNQPLQIQREMSTSTIEGIEDLYQTAPSSITNTPLTEESSLPDYDLSPESYNQSLPDLTNREITSIEAAELEGIQRVQFAVEDEEERNRETPTAGRRNDEEVLLTSLTTSTAPPPEQLTPLGLPATFEGDLGKLVGIIPHKYFFLLRIVQETRPLQLEYRRLRHNHHFVYIHFSQLCTCFNQDHYHDCWKTFCLNSPVRVTDA